MEITLTGDAESTVTTTEVVRTVDVTHTTTLATPGGNGIEITLVESPATTVSVTNPQVITVDLETSVSTVITASTLALSSAGPKGDQGVQGDQGIQGIQGVAGNTYTTGAAALDFGAGEMSATVVVTGVAGITATSIVDARVRMEATADHSVDELSFDPIQVVAKNIVESVGFTIEGRMFNAPARGLYNVNWIVY